MCGKNECARVDGGKGLVIYFVHKEGDETDSGNRRGIMLLMNIVEKVIEHS